MVPRLSVAEADLWGDSPRRRLEAARALPEAERDALRQWVARTAPMKPWPYGMATVANPWLLVLGPSPGNSPRKGDTGFVERPAYVAPTLGICHPEFMYQDSRGYWERIRDLSVGMLRAIDPGLSEADCFALSGQMNLGVGAYGRADRGAVETDYLRWVPDTIVNLLRPRILVLVGLMSLLHGHASVRSELASSGAMQVDWNKPARELPFKTYERQALRYRAWHLEKPDGRTMSIVAWPNHPSRSPMTNREIWRASVREGSEYFASSAL